MRTKKLPIKQGYSSKEAKIIIDRYIDDSAERLQKRLTMAWKKQNALSKKVSYA